MKRLKCESVVKALDLPVAFRSLRLDMPILAMEFCSGGDLRKVLNKPVSRRQRKGTQSIALMPLFYCSTIAAAWKKRKFARFSSKSPVPLATCTI